jgi:Mg/Co/Ni transporter MgtE
VTPIDVDLIRAWLRTEPGNCAAALPRMTVDERLPLLEQLDGDELAMVLAHAPVWWLAAVIEETPDLPWPEAIEHVGLEPALVHALRTIPNDLRESLLVQTSPRSRARLNRALALPKDRVAGIVDGRIRVCHADESVATVTQRIAKSASEDAWIYVTDSDDRYLGQFTLLTLAEAPAERRVGEIALLQRPRIAATLLLEDALRLADWHGHDSLPVSDERGRLTGVLRLGTLARTMRIDEPNPDVRPFDLVGSVVTLWTGLLVSMVSRADRAP